MKTIGIKLADGSFYPVLEEGSVQEKKLELTTANNNQTKVMVDLYRSENCTMDDAEYVDSLQIENLVAHPNGEPDISFIVSLDEDNQLNAKIIDQETGNSSNTEITLVSRTIEERLVTDEYNISELDESKSEAKTAAAVVSGVAVGGGLMAAANAYNKKQEEIAAEAETSEETISTEEPLTQEEAVTEQTENQPEDITIEENIFEEESIITDKVTDEDLFEGMDLDMDTQAPVEETSDDATAIKDIFADMDFDSEPTVEADSEKLDEDIFADFDLDNNSNFTDMDTDMKNDETNNLFDDEPAAGGISFTGLYDKETEFGDSYSDEDDTKKKTKAPVIICVICAIICIIAVLLILFVIPSNCNLLNKNKAPKEEVVIEQTAEPEVPEAVEEPEEIVVVPEAKEDEIIIIEKAEEVVPVQPEVVEKPQDTIYKIKWGDTLWDIADTYYKNPWKYKYIAHYNGIKNPDYIVSGTKIVIPAE